MKSTGPNVVEALAYGDDIVLIAPTPNVLPRLIAFCEFWHEFIVLLLVL